MEEINIFLFHDQRILAMVREKCLGFQSPTFTFFVPPSLDSQVFWTYVLKTEALFLMFSLYLNIKMLLSA